MQTIFLLILLQLWRTPAEEQARSKQFSAYIGRMFLTLLCSIQSVGSLLRDSLDLRREGFKIENVKEHALGTGQAAEENKSNLASPAISLSAPPLDVPEGREPSYHEPDSGLDEEMEEEQSPLVEEALVQLCDKETQTIERASIGSSKKVYPSLLTATRTVAADPSGIPFEEQWNEIQGALKQLTLALEVQQKMGQPHPERRDSPVNKAETAPPERTGFDPVQPISSEQTKEKTVERKTEKGLEQKEKHLVESKEEKPRVLPVNMQKRQ
ncbi:Armadillo Repeat-Containing Protein 6 [Manis pentadactyla]|nr:Armadillo Repeat-Containing Protein 6 [Manis pentadactyla]